MSIRQVVLLWGLTGCYLEGTAGVTPSMSQTLTDANGMTSTSSHQAWTVSIATGFYFDVPHAGLGFSHWGHATTHGPDGTPDVSTHGIKLRGDVNLKEISQSANVRLTAAYTSHGDVDVDATGVTTATMSTSVNGKLPAQNASGSSWFGGLTVEKYSKGSIYFGPLWAVQGSVGLSHLSSTTPFLDSSGTTIPGVSQSGTGVQARLMVMFGSAALKGLRVQTKEERREQREWAAAQREHERQLNQQRCGHDTCLDSTVNIAPRATTPTKTETKTQKPVDNRDCKTIHDGAFSRTVGNC